MKKIKDTSKPQNVQVLRCITSFLDFPINTAFKGKRVLREPDIRPDLEKLKATVLDLLLDKEKHLERWKIAWETHQRNLLPHLDILLVYSKRVKKHNKSFDYLLPYCPQVLTEFPVDHQLPQTRISYYTLGKLSEAAIEYGEKEDPKALSNFNSTDYTHYIMMHKLKSDPYGYLEDRMKQDPYNFDLAEYANAFNLMRQIPNWSAIKSKLLDCRAATIAELELTKPGFHRISSQLLNIRLKDAELKRFNKHNKIYQTIIDHLNQICDYGPRRPHKTSNLLISGPNNTGKTALTEVLAKTVGRYNVKYENKYLNRYSNNKYGFIIWNQVKFTDFSHTWVLQFLEGVEVAIPMRYNSCLKKDNPLIILTSNLTLQNHIERRFGDDTTLYNHAIKNLGARITQVRIPEDEDIFFLQKLILPANQPIVPWTQSETTPSQPKIKPSSLFNWFF